MEKPNFKTYSRYYDLINNDKNYLGEVEYICNLLNKHNSTGKDMLEFGSGTGIHGRMLAEKGFNVLGVELSSDMVRQSIETKGFKCIQGDIRDLKLSKKFNIVLSLFHVISYQVSNSDLINTFKTASSHLKGGGFFVFDVWYSPAVYAQTPGIRLKCKKNSSMEIIRISEPTMLVNSNQVDVKFKIYAIDHSANSYECFEEIHSMRHFTIPEIDLLAKMSGFKLIQSEEFLTSNSPNSNTWGVCFVLQKQND